MRTSLNPVCFLWSFLLVDMSDTEARGTCVLSVTCCEDTNYFKEFSHPQILCLHNSACYCTCNYPQTRSALSGTTTCKLHGTIEVVGREAFCLNQQVECPAHLCKTVTSDILDITAFQGLFLHSLAMVETNLRVLDIFGNGRPMQCSTSSFKSRFVQKQHRNAICLSALAKHLSW